MTPDEYQNYVRAVVDQAPPLSSEQCAVISRVMYPTGWSIVPPSRSSEQLAA